MAPASFVNLIGSVPLNTAEEAMQAVCEGLPGRFYRISDGETGERHMFVLWQVEKIWPKEVLAHKPAWDNIPDAGQKVPKFKLRKQDLPSTTGYAEYAASSYQLFCRMRDSGVIPPGVKFQVCLPTPSTVVGLMLHPDYQVEGEKLYEEILRDDIKTIQHTIPHEDLALQWDILAETAFMEHAYGEPRDADNWFFAQLKPFYEPVREGIAERMARLALLVEPEVDLGLHFCYGDAFQKHFVQPTDAGFLSELVELSLKNMSHHISWVHIPVPADTTEEAYFNPLKSLQLGETSLVLGLVHAHDDQGTKERMATAQRVLPNVAFGISTECGLGRRAKEDLPSIFEICRNNSIAH